MLIKQQKDIEEMKIQHIKNNLSKIFLLQKSIYKSSELTNVFLNEDFAYAIDVDNYEIVWANELMEKEFGNVVGSRCYEAFQGLKNPCPFCKYNLTKEKPYKPIKWIHKNLINHKWYFVEDIYMPNGINGYDKPVHFERAIKLDNIIIDEIKEIIDE